MLNIFPGLKTGDFRPLEGDVPPRPQNVLARVGVPVVQGSAAITYPRSFCQSFNVRKGQRRFLDVAAMRLFNMACVAKCHKVSRIETPISVNRPRHDMVHLKAFASLPADKAGKVVALLDLRSKKIERSSLHLVGVYDCGVWIKTGGYAGFDRDSFDFFTRLLSVEASARLRVAAKERISAFRRFLATVTKASNPCDSVPIAPDDFNGHKPAKSQPFNRLKADIRRSFSHARHMPSIRSKATT